LSAPRRLIRPPLGRILCIAGALAVLAGALLTVLAPVGTGRAAGGVEGEPTSQTDDSVSARAVTFFGASPGEAPGEVWGLGRHEGKPTVVDYTTAGGWSSATGLLDVQGNPLPDFKLAQPESFRLANPSPLAGSMTADGSGALLGTVPAAEGNPARQVLLVRDSGTGAFSETAQVASGGEEALLHEGEHLFGINRAPMVAALDEAGGHAGALVVPVNEGGEVDSAVLHWDGSKWTREPIEIPEHSSEQFQVLAMGASSPENAWLLARLSSEYPPGSVALFRRHLGSGSETASWRPVTLEPGGEAGEPLHAETKAEPFTVPSGAQAQILTVTGEGVWVNGVRRDAQASTTLFFKPQGEAEARLQAAWCLIPGGAPPGTAPCRYGLPEPLPVSEPSRSFAWANPATPEGLGERVITGLRDGLSLRLEGAAFKVVLSLGGNTGESFGAAFADPREGWLGKELLPVHLTTAPAPDRLAPWPVAFRYALLALAPQPEAPVGSLSSEALAVGDRGEVARYEPGQGWQPESLLGPGGQRQTPRLRAVAWPTPERVYAVGDLGQMWLWRGETGLWERDPATPLNFRGNLLGIAFDPANSARGYAVGESGVLLNYGKSWVQEPEEAIPPEARGASFTSIAFSGSEAIVAYRKLLNRTQDRYRGGLIVNDGSGWQIDQGAAAAIGSEVPWAVAGLPDGGAVFTAAGGVEGARIYERQAAGAPWQPVSYPSRPPGSLALFREGGALRVVTSGGEPGTAAAESEQPPPPGFPPNLIPPYPLGSDPEHGVLRQTAAGWSDEEHDLNDAKEPPGEYLYYDTPYQPDPVASVLIDPTGTQGWAAGGLVNNEDQLLDTADIFRYPADGSAPVGEGTAQVLTEPERREGEPPKLATFAIGGGAQCAAPCAERAATAIGPDVWLSAALAEASQITGVRAFVYTGGRVTTGQTAGPAELVVPYAVEQARYAELVGAGTYVAPSPTDLDGARSEGAFQTNFPSLPFVNRECAAGAPGCQGSYYSLQTGSGSERVRVLVLDDTADVGPAQLQWLEGELAAAGAGEPAIVVAHADLAAQIAEGDIAAAALARVLVCGSAAAECSSAGNGASAYFFDAQEENVTRPLRSGRGVIPSFGSGTLGYVNSVNEARADFIGASGFLLAQVNLRAPRVGNVAPVTARLIPNVGELAIEARDGTLIRRSKAALFAGLARRPRSGNRAHNKSSTLETSPYIPIPSNCRGPRCSEGILPEYTFSSSRPDIGDFVEPNLESADPHAVELAANGKPIPDPQSGLFCAYNAGTTIVTLSAGGRSFSLPVTVQAGSVGKPCETVPVKEVPHNQSASTPAPAPAPGPSGPTPAASAAPVPLPVPPLPPLAPAAPPPPARAPSLPNFFVGSPQVAFVPAFVPVPIPTPARPTPPSGTSAVTSPVEAAQKEEEEEAAPESVSNEAVAYSASEHEPVPAYLLGLVLIAALAGVSLRGRRGGRERRVAPATVSTMRSQRRNAPGRGRWPHV
jgi:hypothetical protein